MCPCQATTQYSSGFLQHPSAIPSLGWESQDEECAEDTTLALSAIELLLNRCLKFVSSNLGEGIFLFFFGDENGQ